VCCVKSIPAAPSSWHKASGIKLCRKRWKSDHSRGLSGVQIWEGFQTLWVACLAAESGRHARQCMSVCFHNDHAEMPVNCGHIGLGSQTYWT
jgi:hypothetical protein